MLESRFRNDNVKKNWRKSLFPTMFAIALATITWVPISVYADKTTIEPTKLTIEVRDPAATYGFPDITPDGRYIETPNSQTGKSWLVSMDGHRFPIPGQGLCIYDSTPDGDVIFRYPAGAAPLAYVLRPGTGIVRKFPGKGDKFAAATHFASESTRGHWLECMSNVSGGDPLKELWYDVDDKTVPLLQDTMEASWAPNGVDVASILSTSVDSSAWLVIYHTKSQQRETCGTYPLMLPDQTSTTTPVPMWSDDGRFISIQSNKGLMVYDTDSKRMSSIDIDLSSNLWGWVSGNQLFVIKRMDDRTTFLQYYGIKNNTWTLVDQEKLPYRVRSLHRLPDGKLLMKTGIGSIVLVDGSKQNVIVKSNVDRWWYDVANGYVYFGVRKTSSDTTEPVFRVKVSDVESVPYLNRYINRYDAK